MIFQVFVKFSVIAASFHILNTCMSYKTTYKDVYFLNNDNSNGIGNEFNKKKSYFESFWRLLLQCLWDVSSKSCGCVCNILEFYGKYCSLIVSIISWISKYEPKRKVKVWRHLLFCCIIINNDLNIDIFSCIDKLLTW